MSSWGYTDTNGPHTWHEQFPEAKGARQSPIDVVTNRVTSDTSLHTRPLSWSYVPDNCKVIVNPGYCWRLDVNGEGSKLCGGPLLANYKLEQFHAHWGPSSEKGSEHTVDGRAYAGELHLVHWNCDKYKSFAEAAGHSDGLAVLGIFLEGGNEDHEEMEKIVSLIPQITHKGQSATVSLPIDPSRLIPDNIHYWTYLGSLTTPPCTESVTWILFKEPISISERQLSEFRTIKKHAEDEDIHCDAPECTEKACDSCEGGYVLRNFRPPLPLSVFRSIKRVAATENCDADDINIILNFRPPLPLGNRELRECGQI